MTRWLTGGPAVVNGGPPPLTAAVDQWSVVDRRLTDDDGTMSTPRGTTQVVTRGHLMIECQICRNEVQTNMSADMSVRGTRWQDTSVRGTVQVAAGPIRA
ncbi:hypothetical protein Tco_1355498 [Tanacetum coccineum]